MPTLRVESLRFANNGPYNLIVEPGQCVCITGASGSGKTLLLRSIADLDLHQGAVFLNDSEADTVSAPQWRKRVGLLPAESAWWSDAVGDHFAGVDSELLQQLGFTPEVMGWQVNRLSTGEKQRLSIARLLEQQPRALLLDEPTASLDADNVSSVETVIRQYRIKQKAPIIWVSHDLQQVKRMADRHLVLNHACLNEHSGSLNDSTNAS